MYIEGQNAVCVPVPLFFFSDRAISSSLFNTEVFPFPKSKTHLEHLHVSKSNASPTNLFTTYKSSIWAGFFWGGGGKGGRLSHQLLFSTQDRKMKATNLMSLMNTMYLLWSDLLSSCNTSKKNSNKPSKRAGDTDNKWQAGKQENLAELARF